MHRSPSFRLPLVVTTCALALVASAACRQSRRSVAVGGDAATLKVTMEGLSAEDKARSDRVYELSGCTSVLNGELGAGDVLTYKAVGLKKGLAGCQLRVKLLKTVDDMVFAAGTEPNVIYWANQLTISQDATGALTATANMQKLYTIASNDPAKGKFSLKVPVKFATPEANKPVTAHIICTPEIVEWSTSYPADNPQEGEFLFSVSLDKDTDYKCSEIQIGVAGTIKYKGAIVAGDTDFTAKVNSERKAKQVALVLQIVADEGGVSVGVDSAECKAGEVMDVVARKCVVIPFLLKVPVKFAAAEAGKPVTGRITCTPALEVVATYPDTNPLEGDLVFTLPVNRDTAYRCSEVQVRVADAVKYKGPVPDGDTDFTAKPNAEHKLKQIVLVPQ